MVGQAMDRGRLKQGQGHILRSSRQVVRSIEKPRSIIVIIILNMLAFIKMYDQDQAQPQRKCPFKKLQECYHWTGEQISDVHWLFQSLGTSAHTHWRAAIGWSKGQTTQQRGGSTVVVSECWRGHNTR